VRGRLVHQLEAGVVLEDVEHSAVGLPQELEPWCNNGAVGPVAGLLARNGGEEDGLWGFRGLEIVDVLRLCRCLERGLHLVCLGLRVGDLLLGKLDEAFEDKLLRLAVCVPPTSEFSYLDRSDVGVLGRVLVLVQTVLCEFALAKIDA
jgi:hypothetical protein